MTRTHPRFAAGETPPPLMRLGGVVAALVCGLGIALVPIGPPAAAGSTSTATLVAPLPPPLRVLHAYAAPSDPWDQGNRGVDLAATTGEAVSAGAAGVVLYAGALAGRGVISVDDGSEHLTYEPVEPVVVRGSRVAAGQLIGHVAPQLDTCGPPGSCLHWGVLRRSGYVDPMAMVGSRAVRLLPIWDAGIPAAIEPAAPAAALIGSGAAAVPRTSGSPPPARTTGSGESADVPTKAVAATMALTLASAGWAVQRSRGRRRSGGLLGQLRP